MSEQPRRQLRSGKEFNPYALGHPVTTLDVERLLGEASESIGTSEAPDLPVTLAPKQPTPFQPPITEEAPEQTNDPPASSTRAALTQDSDGGRLRAPSTRPLARTSQPFDKLSSQTKRARERARKKLKLDSSRGKEAARRVQFIVKSLEVAQGDFLLSRAIHSKQGYVGVPDWGRDWRNLTATTASERLAYLRDAGGYTIVDTSFDPSVDYPFVDAAGRIWAVALAEPKGWDQRRAGIDNARRRLSESLAHLKPAFNRRGAFRSYQSGFSFGMGRTIPMNFTNSELVDASLVDFFGDPNVQALFHFVEGGLRTWFPDHWEKFQRTIESAQALHPELKTPVPGSSFPASTINMGDRVVCESHRDSSNEAAAVCLDYVDGPFDPDKGGHLVLHEARRIVKLRKGGVFLFPSAIITHENIDIGQDESWFSLTGYFPGGIRRYLEAGGRTLTEWKNKHPEEAAEHELSGAARWELGCAQFKTATELIRFWQERASEMEAKP